MRTVYFSHPNDWNTFRELVKLRFCLFVSSSETLASLKIRSFPELRESHVVLHRRHRPLRRPARRLDGCLVSTAVYGCAVWRRRLGCRAEMGIVGRSMGGVFFSTWSQGIEAKCSGWLVSRQGRAMCHLGLGDGRFMDLGHLLATWGWRSMIACLICGSLLGAGSAPEDCGMVCLEGVDPDRPKVNQAPRLKIEDERKSCRFFCKVP